MPKYNFYQQFYSLLLLIIIITSCKPQNKPENSKESKTEQTPVSKETTSFITFGPTTKTEN